MVENAGFDNPSILDWRDEELFGVVADFPAEHIVEVNPIRNQSLQAITRMACTRYGLGHIHIAQGITDFDCLSFWKRYLQADPNAERVGATLQSALTQGRDEKSVIGYTRVHTQGGARLALSQGRYIYTGSLNGDWKKVREQGIYGTVAQGVGHIFCIIGYNRDGFRCVNSYGEKDGVFFLANEYRDTLYSRYAIMTDPQLAHDVRVKKDEESKAVAYKYVMSDARPKDNITREEMAIVLGRLVQGLQSGDIPLS